MLVRNDYQRVDLKIAVGASLSVKPSIPSRPKANERKLAIDVDSI